MRLTHGDTGTRLYRIWKAMKCRCLNKNHPSYVYYGARGIRVCPAWADDYQTFKDGALANGYRASLELDRVDVNGDYEPGNCRWTTHREQSLNRRDTLYVREGTLVTRLDIFLRDNSIPVSTFNNWRRKNVENESLSRRVGRRVVVVGGKKNH